MNRQTLSFILAVTLAAAVMAPLPVYAEENSAAENDVTAGISAGTVQEYPDAGVSFIVPESFDTAEGVITVFDGGELQAGSGIVYIEADYAAMTKEDYLDAMQRYTDGTATAANEIAGVQFPLFYVFGISGGGTEEELISSLFGGISDEMADSLWVDPAGSAGDFNYYCVGYDPEYIIENYPDELSTFADEYASLINGREEFEKNFSFSEPELTPLSTEEGDTVQFEAKDLLTGETVTSEELFSGNKITLVNLWATWCGYCVQEMPELENMNRSFQEKECAIIGIVTDAADDEAALQDALDILEDTGVTYRVLIAPENYEDYFPLTAYPTTYFVDSRGTILGDPIVGANLRAYSITMDTLLESIPQ